MHRAHNSSSGEGEHATTTERMRNHHPPTRFFFPPISLFTLIFARPPERMNLSSVFPLPSPLEPCSIFTTSTFSPAIFAAPRNTPVSTVFQMIEVIENSSDRQQLAVNNLVGERVVQRNGTSNRKREHSLRREKKISVASHLHREIIIYISRRNLAEQCLGSVRSEGKLFPLEVE